MPKLSIITVNLNNVEGLRRTVGSVVCQTYADFEWIVVDGGSTDGSRELIESYSDRMSWWVSEADGGIFNAMNKGIAASSGEYLLFLNSGDCLHDSEVLQTAVPQLQGKDFYVGWERRGDILLVYDVTSLARLFSVLSYGALPHQATFINRRAFEKYGLYREDLKTASDWWFFYETMILKDATFDKLRMMVSVFDTSGISSSMVHDYERDRMLSQHPQVDRAIRFYAENYEIVTALRDSRIMFFLFRVYFWFYRHWKSLCRRFRS